MAWEEQKVDNNVCFLVGFKAVQLGSFVGNAEVWLGSRLLQVPAGNDLTFSQSRSLQFHVVTWPRRDNFSLARQEILPFASCRAVGLIP